MAHAVVLRDEVARVRLMVVDGTIGVGQAWTYERLADALDLGVADARRCVEDLAHDGFIDLLPTGFRVRVTGGAEQDEVIALRLIVEPIAIRQAAAAARIADLIALRELVRDIGEASRRRDYDAYHEGVEGLYATLLGLVPNRLLADLVADLRHRTRTEGVRQLVEAGLLDGTEAHYRTFVGLVEGGDHEGVERLVRAGLSTLRFTGPARPGGGGGAVDEYPADLVPFEVDDYNDDGW